MGSVWDMHVWLNGRVVPVEHASVPIDDHGLVAGDAVFTTMRALNGIPIALDRHLARLEAHLADMRIESPGPTSLGDAVVTTVAASGHADARARLTVTAGSGSLGSGAAAGPPNVIVAVTEHVPRTNSTAVTVPWTRNEHGALAGLKTTSYGENVRMLRVASDAGASEALVANTAGQLCEGTGSNVFVVIDGEVITPPLSSGCLAGTARSIVLDTAQVTEADLAFDVLATADEVFLTSSLRFVQPLTEVDGQTLRSQTIGAQVAAAFNEWVANHIAS